MRIYWLDYLKVYALFLVVLGHLPNGNLGLWIYGFHIPLFFIFQDIWIKSQV